MAQLDSIGNTTKYDRKWADSIVARIATLTQKKQNPLVMQRACLRKLIPQKSFMNNTNIIESKQHSKVAGLSVKHIADLRKSGLSNEQIVACCFKTVTDVKTVKRILKSKMPISGSSLGIPYFRPDGKLIPVMEFARFKPDNPRTIRGKTVKYESPRGSTLKLYFPPATCKKLLDVAVPLLITEGEKKAAKADQDGFACIGLAGVEAWSRKRPKESTGKKHGKRELIADFDAIDLKEREVYIVFDSDLADKLTVQLAEWNLSQAIEERGAIVKVVRLPNGPPDTDGKPTKVGLDDFLVAHSPDDLRELLKTALSPQDPAERNGRRMVMVTTDEAVVNEEAIRALSRDKSLYQRAGKLVHVIQDANNGGAPRITVVAAATLRERLTMFVEFVKASSDGEFKPLNPPKWCYEAIAARGEWPCIRVLEGVVTAPVLRPDGSILSTPGYDSQTGLLYVPQGVSFPIVEHPAREDAIRAAFSLQELVKDFPFSKPEHSATWLAFLLTCVARFAFIGPAPLFLIDANIRGSGKSLVADVVALIVTGRDMSRMSNPRDDEEARKRITALAVGGDTLCLIDNIIGGLGCASLDAALTGTVWKDRILGRTEIVEFPLLVTWSATGNNVVLHADTSRRVAHIRLDSNEENPEQRDGFQHPNLREYVRKNRPKLLSDALTILAAFCQAGRPMRKLPNWGSFEGWSDLIRQAIVWIGLPDPGATRTELVEQSDREANALRELIAGWDELDPDYHGLTVIEILDRINKNLTKYEQVRNAISELCPAPPGKLPSAKSLGNKLSHLRKRVVDGACLETRKNRRNTTIWMVHRSNAGSEGSEGSGRANPHALFDDDFEDDSKSEIWLKSDPSEPAEPAKVSAPNDTEIF